MPLPDLSTLSFKCKSVGATREGVEAGEDCSICLGPLNLDSNTYPWDGAGPWLRQACSNEHFFHAGCLRSLVRANRAASCPECRAPLLGEVKALVPAPVSPAGNGRFVNYVRTVSGVFTTLQIGLERYRVGSRRTAMGIDQSYYDLLVRVFAAKANFSTMINSYAQGGAEGRRGFPAPGSELYNMWREAVEGIYDVYILWEEALVGFDFTDINQPLADTPTSAMLLETSQNLKNLLLELLPKLIPAMRVVDPELRSNIQFEIDPNTQEVYDGRDGRLLRLIFQQRARELPAPRTIAPSRDDVLSNLAFTVG